MTYMHWITSFLGVPIIGGTHPTRILKPPKPIGTAATFIGLSARS